MSRILLLLAVSRLPRARQYGVCSGIGDSYLPTDIESAAVRTREGSLGSVHATKIVSSKRTMRGTPLDRDPLVTATRVGPDVPEG